MSQHWESDDYSQSEVDYSGPAKVNIPRKSGTCGKEAHARKCAKWRARNRSKNRDYMRRYMAARRAREAVNSLPDD